MQRTRSHKNAVWAVVALLCSGVFQKWGSAPTSLWWLHLVGFVPALLVLSRLQGRRALLSGWLVGVAANASIFSWIVYTVETFSNLPWVLAVAALLLFSLAFGFYMAVFAWGFAPIRRASGGYWPVTVALWFAAVEYLNPQLFPYYQGVTWYQLSSFFLVTGITGVAGVSFFLLLTNCILVDLWERWRSAGGLALDRSLRVSLGTWLAFVVLACGFSTYQQGRIEAAEATAGTVRVALVQANHDVFMRREMEILRAQKEQRMGIPRGDRRSAITDDLVALSLEAFEQHGDIDVFIWPEGAIRRSPASRRNRKVRQLIETTGAELWTGGGLSRRNPAGERTSFNSAFRVWPRGDERRIAVEPAYDKNILLPFGEFMPFEEYFEILQKIQGVGDFESGDGLTVFEGPAADFVFLICYEAIRHRYVRGGITRGARLLVNITYDAWFGDTDCPYQHLMLSVLQSAQYGVPMVRAATTGISAVADARGRIVARTDPFTRDVLVYDVPKVQVPTPYLYLGDWFAQLAGLLSFLLLVLGWRGCAAGGRCGWLAWFGVVLYAACSPVMWPANPYTPTADWVMWAALVLALVLVAVGWRRSTPSARPAAGHASSDGQAS